MERVVLVSRLRDFRHVYWVLQSAGLANYPLALDFKLTRKSRMATSYDIVTYSSGGRWHFDILELMQGPPGPSVTVYKSEAHNRRGYDTEEEAKKAGQAPKNQMAKNI